MICVSCSRARKRQVDCLSCSFQYPSRCGCANCKKERGVSRCTEARDSLLFSGAAISCGGRRSAPKRATSVILGSSWAPLSFMRRSAFSLSLGSCNCDSTQDLKSCDITRLLSSSVSFIVPHSSLRCENQAFPQNSMFSRFFCASFSK